MTNNLGIFLNNTDSEMSLEINNHNLTILNNTFSSIIIDDINNEYSKSLKEKIKFNNIYKYKLNNNSIRKNNSDLYFNKIKYILNYLKDFDFNKYDYITFINDNYIYLNNLEDYIKYINQHNLDFYSYTDSSEFFYHHQMYIFSINSKSIYNFIKYINNPDVKNTEILKDINNMFDSKLSYLKVAFLPNNIEKNIFFNDELYERFITYDILPIINIEKLLYIKNNFKYTVYKSIPNNFDINIYRLNDDLKNYDDDKLYDHFLNYGQFEFREYSDNEYMLPLYLRDKLNNYSLLKYFDVPNDFNIFKYRDNNKDLSSLSKKEYFMHWVNYGRNENRIYK